MPHRTTIAQVLDRASTLVGVMLPLAALITAAYLTWERVTTWRDVVIRDAKRGQAIHADKDDDIAPGRHV